MRRRLLAASANIVAVLALSFLAAWVILQWATPCEGAALCLATATTLGERLRRSLALLKEAAACWWLRQRMKDADFDLLVLRADLQTIPRRIDHTRQQRDRWAQRLQQHEQRLLLLAASCARKPRPHSAPPSQL